MSRPRSQRVTVRDLAAETGVSIATVSRVLNNQAHVAPHTRDLVERALERLSTQAPGPGSVPARVAPGPVYLRSPPLPPRPGISGAIIVLPPEPSEQLLDLRAGGLPFVVVDPRVPMPRDIAA